MGCGRRAAAACRGRGPLVRVGRGALRSHVAGRGMHVFRGPKPQGRSGSGCNALLCALLNMLLTAHVKQTRRQMQATRDNTPLAGAGHRQGARSQRARGQCTTRQCTAWRRRGAKAGAFWHKAGLGRRHARSGPPAVLAGRPRRPRCRCACATRGRPSQARPPPPSCPSRCSPRCPALRPAFCRPASQAVLCTAARGTGLAQNCGSS
jgi:hypothetical protein